MDGRKEAFFTGGKKEKKKSRKTEGQVGSDLNINVAPVDK